MLMMTPNTLGRTGVIKSFIKHTTPLKLDSKVSSDPQPNCVVVEVFSAEQRAETRCRRRTPGPGIKTSG